MNDHRYKWTLYLIVFVILSTIGIQIYWNYKNYQVNEQQLINDVQISLDNAVDAYYADLAHASTIALTINTPELYGNSLFRSHYIDSLIVDSDSLKLNLKSSDSLKAHLINEMHVFSSNNIDSIFNTFEIDLDSIKSSKFKQFQLIRTDSTAINDFKNLTSKVLISMTQDSLNIKTIDSLVTQELKRKNIDITYQLDFKYFSDFKDFITPKSEVKKQENKNTSGNLSTISKSSFLPRDSILKIDFSNTTKTVLKRILLGIFLSTLLVLAVISCLFYLLKIIKHQKQLAEVKNDLISNITHEFKTPIATIGVALESIKNFNVIDDKEKTKDYLEMSGDQLSKLNLMVEKLLETATLDSENLELNKEPINLIGLLETITNKHKIQLQDKTLIFETDLNSAEVTLDTFHFENAINNIIDNAIKYGGNTITINVCKTLLTTEIDISDDGDNLTTSHKEKIFEKFYRVPKGNTHNIKGFGIGLYYTKKIIEKHNGTVTLNLNNKSTTFKIVLPNG